MSLVMRYGFVGIGCSLFISLTMIGITLLAFPLDDWSILLERRIFNMSYFLLALIIPVLIGGIVGVSIGWFWRQRFHIIDRQLNELVKGEKITIKEDSEKEIAQIYKSIELVQAKFHKQTELSQRQATERANEREKGLQEVVVQERNRLARELHDSVSQQLFAASMMMSAINESNLPGNSTMKQQLSMVEKMIHQSQLEMRALLLHLRPIALKGRSLQEGVEEFLDELIQKVPMEVKRKVESFKVDKGIEDHLFRILQESVSNTLRHAKATSLHVLLIERDDSIILRVVDDGIGFDIEEVRTSSFGLQNMKERSYEVGGTFKAISLPNKGTRIEVKVPRLGNGDETND